MNGKGVEVRRSAAYLRIWIGVIAVLAVGTVAAALWGPPEGKPVIVPFLAVFTGLCLFGFAYYRAEAFILYPDRIERRGLFGVRSRRRDEVTGLRSYNGEILLLTSGRGWRPSLPAYVLKNVEWVAWLETCRNLDAEDFEAAAAKVDADDSLGASVDQRRQSADQRGRISKLLAFAGLALLTWIIVTGASSLPIYVACTVAPLAVAAALVLPNLFTMTLDGPPGRINLFSLLFGATFGLAIKASNAPIIDGHAPLLIGAGMAAAAAGIKLLRLEAVKAMRIMMAVFFGVFALAYGYGASVLLNVLLDDAPPNVLVARVTHTSGRATGEPRMSLQAEGGPDLALSSFRVSSRAFEAHARGGRVCLVVFPGKFGWRWVQVMPCTVRRVD